jgi:transposase InsO family protein
VRWHRAGFRCYWRWKSRPLGGRPQIDTELRALIQRMSVENPLWGAPRIHGELLKLGFEVAQSSVAKYMVKRRGPPSQGWRTFWRNHAPDIAAMDLFVVPTIGFDLLYAFVIVRLGRRELVWTNVTANPTAEWVARQITEAFPWDEAPHYLIRDRDRIYGSVVTCRLRAMGIRDKPTAPASPWQNSFAERLIGSIRRECVDHTIVLGEVHLRRVPKSYADYYNCVRTHRSLKQGCAGFSPGSANRCDQFTRHPWRTSSPLRPSLSFRYTHAPYLTATAGLDGPQISGVVFLWGVAAAIGSLAEVT